MKPIAEKGLAAQVRHRLGGLCHPSGVYRTIPARVNPRKNGKNVEEISILVQTSTVECLR